MPLAKSVVHDLRFASTRSLGFIAALALCTAPVAAISAESHPGLAAEASYTEALIAFSHQDWDRALKLVNEALQGSPDHIEALELKALIHKTKSQDDPAIQAYEKLLGLKPEKERGPYEFELAALYRRKKRDDLARPLMEKALARGFNVGASHFFLGLMDFEAGNLAEAEEHFRHAASDREPELQMSGLFYLGLIDFRQGNGVSGMERLSQARELTASIKEVAKSAGLAKAADRMLAPFDRGKFFASFTLLPLYDSNSPTFPLTGFAPSGNSTLAARARLGGGYVTSPLKSLQLVYALKASTNIEGQPSALPYQFLSVSPSIALNAQPFSRTSWGASLSFDHALQYSYGDASIPSYSADRPFSNTVSLKPYLKFQPSSELKITAEAAISQQSYSLNRCDPALYPQLNCGYFPVGVTPSPLPRFYPMMSDFNGVMLSPRIRAALDSGPHLFNPSATIGADWNNAGSAPSFGSLSAGVANLARIDGKNTLQLSIDASGTVFYNLQRSDGTLGFHLDHVFQIFPNWSLIADSTFLWNTSSWSEYSFTRFTGGVGISWNL